MLVACYTPFDALVPSSPGSFSAFASCRLLWLQLPPRCRTSCQHRLTLSFDRTRARGPFLVGVGRGEPVNLVLLDAKGKLMHKSRLGNIVIDCKTEDLLSQAEFWSNALGYPLPQDIDVTSKFIQLVTPPGEVQVIIQRVGHEARAHLDIETDSIESEVARLGRLGAVVVVSQ